MLAAITVGHGSPRGHIFAGSPARLYFYGLFPCDRLSGSVAAVAGFPALPVVAGVPALPVLVALPAFVVGAIVPVVAVAAFTVVPVVVVAAAPVPVAAPPWIPELTGAPVIV